MADGFWHTTWTGPLTPPHALSVPDLFATTEATHADSRRENLVVATASHIVTIAYNLPKLPKLRQGEVERWQSGIRPERKISHRSWIAKENVSQVLATGDA